MILCILLYISNRHFSPSHHHGTRTAQSVKGVFSFLKISIPTLFMLFCYKEEVTVVNSSFSVFFMVRNILAWNKIFCGTLNFWSALQPPQIQSSMDQPPLVCNVLFPLQMAFFCRSQ